MTDYDADIRALESEMDNLNAKKNAIYKKVGALREQRQKEREAAAGDPQAGDIVVILSDFGSAKRGDLVRVIERVTPEYPDGYHAAVLVEYLLAEGSLTAPLAEVVRVNDPEVVGLWLRFNEAGLALRRLVLSATGIWPTIP